MMSTSTDPLHSSRAFRSSSAPPSEASITYKDKEMDRDIDTKRLSVLDGELKKPNHPYAREWSTPAPRAKGGWEFVPGTDLSFAVVGVPDPSKFSFMRRDAADHSKSHIPLFPRHTHFDWHSVEDIAALNKWRDQVQKRTLGKIGKLAASFTQPEKDVLTSLVENDLKEKKGGSEAGKVDWAKVASELHKAFEGRTQKTGTEMAQPSFLDGEGNEVMHYSAPKKLKQDRIGPVKRQPSNVELIGMRFAKIEKIIRDHHVGKHRRIDNNRTRLVVPKRLTKKKRVEDADNSENVTEVEDSQAGDDHDGGEGGSEQKSKKRKIETKNNNNELA